jgi:alanyl-tRNA synthetase
MQRAGIITDRVNPFKKDRGYVVRRLFRCGIMYARTLFGSSEKIYGVIETVIAQFGVALLPRIGMTG